ncbi:hypothetical protein [Geodermatophilus sp. DF01-2]|uniref:hypothetical protein n=1 Tax=Geodermatophilus sp. DF01-2 TaxID=2559610 RepID=UPI0010731709|nr:hypothetical protein [Geodermatophilus sp. DF01_2]
MGPDGSDGRVAVTVTRPQVTAAPSVGGTRELSRAQEEQLHRHYGIGSSREAAESLLPGAAADTPAAGGTTAGRRTLVAVAALGGRGGRGSRTRRSRPRPRSRRRLLDRAPLSRSRPTRADRVGRTARAAAVRMRARH